MPTINMLDLKTEFHLFEDEIRTAVNAVLESQHFIGGPAIAELERYLAGRIGVGHGIGVTSGTDALLCALMALDLKPGDEVIVPAFTFFATAGSVARLGAKPVFVDVDPKTFNMTSESFAAAITPRTRAVIVVHLFGQVAEMANIVKLAGESGITVVEDAAQAIGADDGKKQACAIGDMATLSFYPTKNLGGFGEGGMILTDRDDLAEKCRQLRNHGESSRYVHESVGGNFRLDTMKAAILLVKSQYLGEFNNRRRNNARFYDRELARANVVTPYVPPGHNPVFHQYTIQSDARDQLQQFLADRGIGSTIYYPVPLHMQKCFEHLGYRPGSLPVVESLSQKVLSIPCHPMLSDEELQQVASSIHEHGAIADTVMEPQPH